MEIPQVRVFFYGSFINRHVLARVEMVVEDLEVAKLWGFDIRIKTLATLVRSDRHCVYGILCHVTHAELTRLYGQSWLGDAYLPEAIVVETHLGQLVSALCYIAPTQPPVRPADDYLDWILAAARELGFPVWYVERLQDAGM